MVVLDTHAPHTLTGNVGLAVAATAPGAIFPPFPTTLSLIHTGPHTHAPHRLTRDVGLAVAALPLEPPLAVALLTTC